MMQLNAAGVRWVSRVPETSTAAQGIVQERLASLEDGRHSPDGTRHWWSRKLSDERWSAVRTQEGEARARPTVERHVARALVGWDKRLLPLGHHTFAAAPGR